MAYYPVAKRQKSAVGKQKAQAKLKVYQLASPVYRVTELIGGQSIGTFTPSQLQEGLPMSFQAGELKILKCSSSATTAK